VGVGNRGREVSRGNYLARKSVVDPKRGLGGYYGGIEMAKSVRAVQGPTSNTLRDAMRALALSMSE